MCACLCAATDQLLSRPLAPHTAEMPSEASVSSTGALQSVVTPLQAGTRRGRGPGHASNNQAVELGRVADAISAMSAADRPPQVHAHSAVAAHNPNPMFIDSVMKEAIAAIRDGTDTDNSAVSSMNFRRAIRLVIQAGFDPTQELPGEALEAGPDLVALWEEQPEETEEESGATH